MTSENQPDMETIIYEQAVNKLYEGHRNGERVWLKANVTHSNFSESRRYQSKKKDDLQFDIPDGEKILQGENINTRNGPEAITWSLGNQTEVKEWALKVIESGDEDESQKKHARIYVDVINKLEQENL